ncbi:MAG: transporter, partial [Candidatus Eremiobacterota bacterium]
ATMRMLLILLLLLGLPASGQELEDPLITDRPDQAEAPYTVGSGRFQIESGVLYELDRGGGDRVLTPTLLRVGTGPDTELRIEGDLLTFEQRRVGLSDFSLGAKVNLTDQDWGALALLGRLNFPTGTNGFAGHAVVPELALLSAFPLSEEWALAVSLQGGLPRDDTTGDRYLQGFFATALGYSISERLGVFVEVFGNGPQGDGGPFELATDAGLTYLLSEDLQLDLAAVKGLSATGLDWGVTLGVSARF